MEIDQSRRGFILGSAALMMASALPLKAFAMQRPRDMAEISPIKFLNLHTNEVFYLKDIYDEVNLAEADDFFRDFRTGEVSPMDIDLLAQVSKLYAKVGKSESVIEVISGYRSSETNASLAKKSTGVAKKSLHMQGRAIDLNISGVGINDQYLAARDLNLGGVGKYQRSKFIHLDTGPVRTWIGG
jgi:uncharacterized protein YcbK (DUF882 family)